MTLIDLACLRPTVEDVQLVAGALTELGEASAGELAAELPLNLATIAGVLRSLERAGRARRSAAGWVAVVPGKPPSARRRSWRQGGSLRTSDP